MCGLTVNKKVQFVYLKNFVNFTDTDPFLLIHLENVALLTIHQENQEAHYLKIRIINHV